MKMTVGEIVSACGGKLLCGSPETTVTSVCTDSRKITPGALFVPIKGEKTDAHTLITATFAAGAAATLTEEHSEMSDFRAWIAVPSTERALQQIAAVYRKKFNIPFVGITGSVGKTTTKEMIALALSAGLNIMKTEGNYNSQIGLPLTMFRLRPEHQAAVIEMGMSNFGEMSRLVEIAAPDFAVITNIGISHIQQLKTQENILREKLHIADRFHPGSVLFLNGDDDYLAGLRDTWKGTMVFYGTQPWCDYRAMNIREVNGCTGFTLKAHGKNMQVVIPVLGRHNVNNALAGLAVAQALGIPLSRAAAKLETYQPPAMRQQIHYINDLTIIDDSYNASPDSIRSSVDVLCSFRGGKRIAVLADMLELGEYSRKAHFQVGVYAAGAGVDVLLTVGEEAKEIARGARSEKPEITAKSFQSNDEAVDELRKIIAPGDAILIKGSRGMQTDQIVHSLLQ
jgi:UDP-N-acetylmuramoyl-tripeptide--D-alanyl-D-alanine ligase